MNKGSNTCCPYCCAKPGEEHLNNCPRNVIPAMKAEFDKAKITDEPMLDRKKASDLLKYADHLINGPRAQDYGPPHESFKKIAKLWSTYLHTEITVTDVGMMMILLKVARNGRGKNKDDNFVDICGYAALTGSACFDPVIPK